MTDKPTVTLRDTRIVQTILGITETAVPVQTFELFQHMVAAYREEAIKEAIKEAVELLKPFARIAEMESNAKGGASVMVNVSRCRDALAFLTSAKGQADE